MCDIGVCCNFRGPPQAPRQVRPSHPLPVFDTLRRDVCPNLCRPSPGVRQTSDFVGPVLKEHAVSDSSWCLNQPIWKNMGKSNWIILSSGVKNRKISELPPPRQHLSQHLPARHCRKCPRPSVTSSVPTRAGDQPPHATMILDGSCVTTKKVLLSKSSGSHLMMWGRNACNTSIFLAKNLPTQKNERPTAAAKCLGNSCYVYGTRDAKRKWINSLLSH